MSFKKKFTDLLERYSFNDNRFYFKTNLKFIVMDFHYDLLRIILLIISIFALFSGWFITFLILVFVLSIMAILKRTSLIYKIIRYFQYESDYADAEDIFNYVKPKIFFRKNSAEKLINAIDDVIYALSYANKIDVTRGNIQIYKSKFSGPFKKTSRKEEIRVR